MLNMISLILMLTSFSFTVAWRNSIHTGHPQDPEGRERIQEQKRKAQKFSLYLTGFSFVYTMFVFYPESGWVSIWGAIAVLSAIWGLVYLYKCKKRGTSPLDGRIVKNGFYNFFLTEVPFCYLYVFTWIQLGTIAFNFGVE
jgi:hypothetical protein